MRKFLWSIILSLLIASSIATAQNQWTTVNQLRVKTDANGYLMATGIAQTAPISQPTVFSNARIRTDANGYLLVVIAGGTALFGDGVACSAPSISFASSPTTGFYLVGGQVFTCIGGSNVGGFTASGISINANSGTLSWASSSILTSPTNGQLLATNSGATTGVGFDFTTDAVLSIRNRTFTGGSGAISTGTVVANGTLNVQGSQITAGTDITTTNPGDVTLERYQATITPASGGAANCATQAAGFKAAALTADCVIATLPAGVKLIGAYADVTAGFTCSGTCTGTKTFSVGISAGGVEVFAAGLSVTALARFGLLDADMGTLMTRAGAIQGGYLPSWTATTTLTARFTSGTGNWGNAAATFVNAGSIKFTLLTTLVK